MTLDKVQLAIGHMISELPPLASLSIKRGDRFWDIRVEIKPEAEPAPDTKKKKPSPSRLQRNQRRLRMLLERSKIAERGCRGAFPLKNNKILPIYP